jgi:hypothetical protein
MAPGVAWDDMVMVLVPTTPTLGLLHAHRPAHKPAFRRRSVTGGGTRCVSLPPFNFQGQFPRSAAVTERWRNEHDGWRRAREHSNLTREMLAGAQQRKPHAKGNRAGAGTTLTCVACEKEGSKNELESFGLALYGHGPPNNKKNDMRSAPWRR